MITSTATMAATAQGVEMFWFIGTSPASRLLVGQAVLGAERRGIRARRHLAVAAHLSGNEEIRRVGMVVDLPVVLRDRVEGGEPLLALHVAIVEDEVRQL